MPYDFGNAWGQIGADLGAKLTGRPSARQAKDADRALAIKMAQDKEAYQHEQDEIKNFNTMGGDPERIMAGGEEAAFMGTESEEAFKANLATPGKRNEFKSPSQNFKAYQDFQDRIANKIKYKGRTMEDQLAIDAAREEGKRETNAARISETAEAKAKAEAKAEADKLARIEEMLKEPPDYTPGSNWNPRNWGRGSPPTQDAYKSKSDVQAAYDAKKITAKQAQAEYAKFK